MDFVLNPCHGNRRWRQTLWVTTPSTSSLGGWRYNHQNTSGGENLWYCWATLNRIGFCASCILMNCVFYCYGQFLSGLFVLNCKMQTKNSIKVELMLAKVPVLGRTLNRDEIPQTLCSRLYFRKGVGTAVGPEPRVVFALLSVGSLELISRVVLGHCIITVDCAYIYITMRHMRLGATRAII